MKRFLLSIVVVGVVAGQGNAAVSSSISKRLTGRIATAIKQKVAPLTVIGGLCLSLASCELQRQMAPEFTASDNPSNPNKANPDAQPITTTPPALVQAGTWELASAELGSGTLDDSSAYLPNDRFTTTIDVVYGENISEPNASFVIELRSGDNELILNVSSSNFSTDTIFDLVDSNGNYAGFGRHGGTLSVTNNRLGGFGRRAPMTSLFLHGDVVSDGRSMAFRIEPEANDNRLFYATYGSQTAFSFLGKQAAQSWAFRGAMVDSNPSIQ